MNTKRLCLLMVTTVFVIVLSLNAVSAQETESVTCDADLVLTLYVAQRFFDFDSFNSQLSSDTMVDVDNFDKGQLTTLFDALASNSSALEVSDATRASITDMLLMSDTDFDAHMSSMMSGDATSLATGTVDEAEECAALRQTLRRFFIALAVSDVQLSSTSTETETGTTDTGGTSTEAGVITVSLIPAEEVPGPGEEGASGTATVYLRSASNEVCVDISIDRMTFPATAAHIHEGAAGVAGPPVVTLNAPSDTGLSSTCATVDAALMQALIETPENYYVNVHNEPFPSGAIRGQLTFASTGTETTDTTTETTDTSDTNAGAGESGEAGVIAVSLSGAAEVPGPGDEDASGTATVYLRGDINEVCVDLSIQNITFPATAAHIHQAPVGEAGPPVVTLTTPSDTGLSNTCATVDATLMQEMITNPQNFYINVHNAEFPDGAARGQLQ
jgi:hypothetical protein